MPIYLHETADVISGKMDEYTEALGREALPFLKQVGMHLCGFWQVNYSSGRWPEAVVIWEIADWSTYTAQMKAWALRIATAESGNNRYMYMAPKWRSGGFDRILIPVAWSPRPPTPPVFKASGGVFFHHIIHVRPGEARTFLGSVEKNVIPHLGDVGVTLEGFWRNTFDPLEYIALYSVPGWDGYERLQKTRAADDEGSQLPGLSSVWKHMAQLKEKVLLSSEYSPLGGGVPTLGSAL
jgi:hypothetical protein